jgi:uncharacterized protein YqjF (DUF2071 family)
MSSKFLTAEWRKLAIANYVVDPKILAPYLPYKTVIDLWNGNCYVSLVGFRFINTRLKGIAVPFHRDFEEVNLRFYVRYKDATGWKRGVTFIKEIVPKRALTFIANTFYKEKYVTLPMKHDIRVVDHQLNVSYAWKCKERWHSISLQADQTPCEIAINSEEEFITEHYWGYTPVKAEATSEYEVSHPRWQVYPVNGYTIDVDFDTVYGKDFAFLKEAKPVSVMLAEGSGIAVLSKQEIV